LNSAVPSSTLPCGFSFRLTEFPNKWAAWAVGRALDWARFCPHRPLLWTEQQSHRSEQCQKVHCSPRQAPHPLAVKTNLTRFSSWLAQYETRRANVFHFIIFTFVGAAVGLTITKLERFQFAKVQFAKYLRRVCLAFVVSICPAIISFASLIYMHQRTCSCVQSCGLEAVLPWAFGVSS